MTHSVIVDASSTSIAHTGTTAETTLVTTTIPAGAMGKNGRIVVETYWSYTNSVNDKTLRVKFGGTNYRAFVATTTTNFRDRIAFGNANATNSQIGGLVGSGTAFVNTTNASVTSAVDTTAAVALLITAQLANAGETITLEGYRVELLRGAT